MKSYERRVQDLQAQGLTRSDAQGVIDAEDAQGVTDACQNATLTCPECSESIYRAEVREVREYAGELDQYGQDVSLEAVTSRAYYCPECGQRLLEQFENNITPFQSFAELAEHIKEC